MHCIVSSSQLARDRADSLGHPKPDQGKVDFRLLVDGIWDYGIFMLDPEGTVLTWNPGAKRMTGYEADEIHRPELFEVLS
jgi:PAS domain-containing protein